MGQNPNNFWAKQNHYHIRRKFSTFGYVLVKHFLRLQVRQSRWAFFSWVWGCPNSTYPTYFFSHAIALSINQIYNSVLIHFCLPYCFLWFLFHCNYISLFHCINSGSQALTDSVKFLRFSSFLEVSSVRFSHSVFCDTYWSKMWIVQLKMSSERAIECEKVIVVFS